MLRRYVAILLISLYAFANTEFHEMLRFPILVEHFMEHRALNPNLTIGQFLYMHYGQSQSNNKDYQRDMQLPFKSDVSSVFHIVLFTPALVAAYIRVPLYGKEDHILRNTDFIPLYTASKIWQPPKA